MDDNQKIAAVNFIRVSHLNGESRQNIEADLVERFGMSAEEATSGAGYVIESICKLEGVKPGIVSGPHEVAKTDYFGPNGDFMYSRSLVIGDVEPEEGAPRGRFMILPEWGDRRALDYVVGA